MHSNACNQKTVLLHICAICLPTYVQHLQANVIPFRDLKPENFLLSNKEPNAPLKATDFGLSVFYHPGQTFSDIVGSAYYVAPEVTLHTWSDRQCSLTAVERIRVLHKVLTKSSHKQQALCLTVVNTALPHFRAVPGR